MKKYKAYKYLGRNGILITRVYIEAANPIVMTELIADEGKILTNGERQVHGITVELNEVNDWKEIADENN